VNASNPQNRTGRKHLATGLLGVAAGLTAGILATTIAVGSPAVGVPPQASPATTSPADPGRFGSPGHVTMSADAIEMWIRQGCGAIYEMFDPRHVGSTHHVTMSADAMEQWILDAAHKSGCDR